MIILTGGTGIFCMLLKLDNAIEVGELHKIEIILCQLVKSLTFTGKYKYVILIPILLLD